MTVSSAAPASPVSHENPVPPAVPGAFPLPEAVRNAILDHFPARGDPVYLYDSSRIRALCREFRIPCPNLSVHFATMANVHERFLELVREEGMNVFVNSPSHLRAVRNAGFGGEQIVYTASAMDDDTMIGAHAAGALVNLDSTGQIRRWMRLFPDAFFGIRCNIGGLVEPKKTRGGYFIGKESRLGLLPEEIDGLRGNPLVEGLHLYAGTDICSIDYFRACYEALAGFAGLFPNLSYLDLGGGFGVHDENGRGFDFQSYGRMLSSVMEQINGKRPEPVRVILEPGRIIGAAAGYFACRVVDVKYSNGRQLIGVHASSVQFPRPLLYPDSAFHPAALFHLSGAGPVNGTVPTAIYGCSTYSRDFLARDIRLPPASENDIVVFGEAGSYCASAYTCFLGFERAREVFA